jgi:hypothetical protein
LFVNFSRLDDFEKKKNGAPRLVNFIAAHFGRLMMCLIYVCSRRNFEKKKELLAAKGQKIIAVIRLSQGQQIRHSYSYNFTSTPSPVTARLYSTSLNN